MSLTVPPAREYLTAAEAAAEQLPGFAFAEQHIRRFIASGELPSRMRQGTRGREFCYRDLPAEAQAEYLKRYGRSDATLKTDDIKTRAAEKQLRAQARAAIVDAAEVLIVKKGEVGAALKIFSKLYKTRKLGLQPWIYEQQATADPDQVRAWRRKLKRDGLDGLLDGRGKSGRPSNADTELRNIIIAEIGARPHLAVASTKDDEEGGLQGIIRRRLGRDIPVRTLQRYVAPLRSNRNPLVQAVSAPGKFKNSHKTAIGSYSHDVVRINQRWEMDATRGDVMCVVTDENGKKSCRRFALTQVIDICTRRSCIVVSDQPCGAASRATIRKAIIRWGIPEEIKTDNGNEFVNYDTERMCRELNINLEFSTKFSPWEKPHVERMFGTILHCLFEKLPGYVGHSVADRIEIENKRSFQHRYGVDRRVLFEVELSPADLQARIDAWLERFYEQALHVELGTSPALSARVHAEEARLVSDERVLDALMMNAKICKVSKGLIRYKNRYYGSDQTGAIEVTPRFNERVQLRVDPLDPSWAAVYSPDGDEFLCVAKDVDLLDGPERRRMAVVASRNQDKVVNLFVRGIRKIGPTHNIIDTILSSEVPGLVLTGPSAEGMIRAAAPQIEKHVRMIEARDAMDTTPAPVEPTDEERAAYAAKIAELEPLKPAAPAMQQCDGYVRPSFEDDDHGFFDWALARIAAGEPLDTVDTQNFDYLRGDAHFQKERQRRADQPSTGEKGVA
jgi:putative transposase